ncbi:MAG: hypothetical protein IKA32_01365 [Lentisphaeria bacterium]|nr:hypothetical protein [Lentisphaeria bacterium]
MRIKKFPGCIAGILPLLLVVQAADAGEQKESVRHMRAVRPYSEPVQVVRHRERIQKIYAAQDTKLTKADSLCGQSKFKEAVALCEDVLAELELELASVKSHVASARVDMVKKKIADIKDKWSRDLLRKARLAAADKKYDDCVALATQAAVLSPLQREEANNLITYGRGMKSVHQKEQDTALRKTVPDLKKQQSEFKRLLGEAKTYFRNGKLDLARDCVEKAFVINPYDREAIMLAGNIYRKLFLDASYRRRSDVAGVIAYTAWQWTEPTFNLVLPDNIPGAEKRSIGASSEKLKNIRFAGFHFDDADLAAVLTYIQDRSKEGDPEKDERYKGVTVGHMLTPDLVEKTRVTLSLDNVSLATVLECLSLVTGLKYEVSTRNGLTSVNFAPQANEMITHVWDAPRDLRSVVTGKAPAAGGEGTGAAGSGKEGAEGDNGGLLIVPVGEDSNSDSDETTLLKGGAARENVEISSEELKNYLAKCGVNFPSGSSIRHSARTRKIVATNTRDAIYKIDECIDQIAAAAKPLVMVEIKAIEISETDYQDLGFDWTISSLSSGNMDTVTGNLKSGSHGWQFGQGVNTLPGTAMALLRGGTGKTDAKTPIVNNWNIFPALFGSHNPLGSDIPLNISLTINALSHSERTETLSAPKIVTQNGKLASVEMMTTYYFPEDWDEMEVEVISADDSEPVYQVTPPLPDFPEDGEPLGIKLRVLPTIHKNHDISLNLKLGMTSYIGPDNYEVTFTGTSANRTTIYTFTVWKPIISQRTLETQVDISDGETLVVGGMVQNQAIVRVDKIPILGDLPLIGRFFQSQAENMERTNLLMFVTARLIDDHGMPIKRNRVNALPEYNR